jgi:hypothetical protein
MPQLAGAVRTAGRSGGFTVPGGPLEQPSGTVLGFTLILYNMYCIE